MDTENQIIQLIRVVSRLDEKVKDLDKHFTNHLHRHWVDRSINVALFLATIIMFCILKWMK